MAWNEPGGSGGKDPWGQRKKDQGPPDLDQIVRNIQRRLGKVFGGGSGGAGGGHMGRFSFSAILIAAAVLWLVSGFYMIRQGERGVVLEFGRSVQVTQAGLHWHIPFPVEKVDKVNVQRVYVVQIGYRSSDRAGGSRKVPDESQMLTSDENIVDIELAIQYKIKDPADYLFNVRDPTETIIQGAQSAVREVVGQNKMNFVLTDGRNVVAQDTQTLLQKILDKYHTGIHIVTVRMQDARPPQQVTAAFEDAVKAREDEQRLKDEAQAYANDVIPRAKGAAARLVLEAQGYQASVIARAEGDASRFGQIVTQYDKAPEVTRERLYLQTMQKVLGDTTKVFVDLPRGNNVIYLPLNKIVGKSGTAAGSAGTPQPLPEPGTAVQPGSPGQSSINDSLRGRGR
ncbi:MAG: FtsH protease activity modulator HflK [Acidiferrobacterales bacterium]